MPRCANCGTTTSQDWIYEKGIYYCSAGCLDNQQTLQKYKGKSGVLSGLGQMVDGSGVGGGGMSADNLVGGAGKVAMGLGGAAIGAIGASVRKANERSKEMIAEGMAIMNSLEEKKKETLRHINSLAFSDNAVTAVTLTELLRIAGENARDNRQSLSGGDKEIYNAAIQKAQSGIQQLRTHGDNENAEFFEKKVKELALLASKGPKAVANQGAIDTIKAIKLDGDTALIAAGLTELFDQLNENKKLKKAWSVGAGRARKAIQTLRAQGDTESAKYFSRKLIIATLLRYKGLIVVGILIVAAIISSLLGE